MCPPPNLDEIGPRLGERFPDIRLRDQNGLELDLHQERDGHKALVVFIRSASW